MKRFLPLLIVLFLVYRFGIANGQTLFEIIEPFARRGDVEDQYNLGLMYVNGQGVTQDYVQAHKWINITNANGHVNAKKFKERLEIRMTPKQIEEAKKLANKWMDSQKNKYEKFLIGIGTTKPLRGGSTTVKRLFLLCELA